MARARVILRYSSVLGFVSMLFFVTHVALWLKITLAPLIILPLVINAIRSYQFYKRYIKNGQRYN